VSATLPSRKYFTAVSAVRHVVWLPAGPDSRAHHQGARFKIDKMISTNRRRVVGPCSDSPGAPEIAVAVPSVIQVSSVPGDAGMNGGILTLAYLSSAR